MHIPDGFMSPSTMGVLGLGMIPVWLAAAMKTARSLKIKQVPLLSLGAAFSFVIMMFNIPLPNGTTLHPVGTALMAIILGPWAATIGITIALVIQALFFGDGGITAIGANSFNIAFAMSFISYYTYKLISGRSAPTSFRRLAAGAAAGFAGINAAAFLTAFELGIQPLLFHAADGKALYFPYTLSQTIPPISIAHILVGGPVEGIITALVIAYFQKANLPMLALYPPRPKVLSEPVQQSAGGWKKYWLALGALVVLSPLGILASGAPWGDWSPEEIEKMIGYLPRGIAKATEFKFKLFPDYAISGWNNTFFQSATGYIISAVAGLLLIFLAVYLFSKFQAKGEKMGSNNKPLPDWMLENRQAGLCKCGCIGAKKKVSFLEKTINDVAGMLKESVFSEQLAGVHGLLQNIDPRVKLATIVFLLVVTALVRNIPVLAGLYLFTLTLAYFSCVPLGFFVKRVWVFIPFFTGIVVIPSIFNFVRPGDPLFTVLNLGRPVNLGIFKLPETIAITKQGLSGAALIILRVGVSVSLAVLLTITSKWGELLKALRVFFIPKIFIMVLEMTYRYIFLLLTVITDMFVARKSRSIGPNTHRENRRFISVGIGNVFGKAYFLSEEIHDAMISRGYTGEAKVVNDFKITLQDIVWIFLILAVGILFLGGDLILGR